MKNHLLRFIVIGLLAALLPLASCDPFGDVDDVVRVTEDIATSTTWYGDKIYVIERFDLSVTATLVIEPGTIVKFHPTRGPLMTLGLGGLIDADGTPTAPIIFTSYYDDEHGGDTNRDGSGTPAPGDWEQIETNGEDASYFDHCEFYYGGGGTYLGTLVISGGSEDVTVTNCTFAHNDGGQFFDIYHGVLDANGGGAGVVIQNNVFFDNNLPLSISDLFSIDDSNVFHDPDNVSVTNTCNGIFVYAGSVDSPISWGETEVAFVIDDVDWWIGGFGTLTLADNVVLKFTEDGTLSMIYGTGLVNYLGAGVYFTSFNDDARKGDTNGDGLSVGVDDYWTGIYNDEPEPIGEWWTYGNILYDTDHP